MKELVLILFAVALTAVAPLRAQQSSTIDEPGLAFLQEMEDTLGLLAYAVVNDSIAEHRFGACREMIPRLVKALKVENSFEYPFEKLRPVSIQYPQDSSFRIFTWQLYVDENDYRYYGAIQMNSPELKLYPLIDRSFKIEDAESAVLSPENWYGAVYYNLLGFDTPDGSKAYLLFGFDGDSFFRKRKLIDVLRFQDDGPVFGAPVFVKEGNQRKNRVMLEYSAEVSTHCNYDGLLEMVIFDHLIPMNGPYGEGMTNYPDGSYEAYRLQNGLWMHVDKVFNQVSDEAPRPTPILDNRPKDIFGRQ
ncbi:MAG: hypothetical protein KDC66_00705 [Phaeodactylibacter sp.]|nr:hypothetical protein [Phaeodactylibacter sp.]MCB9273284.1 hypothetical protein [Lewinellaceae bacterium]